MSPKKRISKNSDARTALCYIRRSMVRDEKDLVSPEIQRQNILRICELSGYVPEWYEDIDGHRSGMHETGRPGWLALKARLNDDDVVALVANDLSRLHRKGWRVGDLLDFADQRGIHLILADPNKQIDFSTPQGRVIAQLSAIFDEWYAVDVSLRRKANIAHRKAQQITVGLPPFGTKRGQDGYLIPNNEGAWWLGEDQWVPGVAGDAQPQPGAVWHSYYETARRVLELYAEGVGRTRICERLRAEGYPYRDRKGNPGNMDVSAVRRVTSNWTEYGGIVLDSRATARHFTHDEITSTVLNPERAVFDTGLLKQVAHMAVDRALLRPDAGRRAAASVYPLSGLIYCAHCETLASRERSSVQRSKLIGVKGNAYRHRQGLYCNCHRRQSKRSVVEGQFRQIISQLSIAPDMLDMMKTLASEIVPQAPLSQDVDAKRTAAIAKCRRKLEAARHLYEDGEIARDEYLRRRENNEREIAQWTSYTSETAQVMVELMVCVEALRKLSVLWDAGSDVHRNELALSLFDHIIFDLDQQRIVDFQLKSWAEKFLVLRANLPADEEGLGEAPKVTIVTPIGLEPITN
ncbi:MAG: recombinase family protein [Pleurocapsa minor GSE-CHR-MK-17-07R]|nr:recombinase family protein [Pleurocapsa minor GSE-CHR-MK 17-07R]